MHVYVESNFVLELAFDQEQAGSCRDLLAHCERDVRLFIPAFAVSEPFQAFGARSKSRKRAADDLAIQLNELARSANRAQEIETVRSVTGLLVQSLEQERAGLRSAMRDVLAVAEVLPLDLETLQRADVLERHPGLPLQDAIVLASVLRHRESAAAGSSVFLNRNRRDFEDPDVVALLERMECKLISNFGDGLGYVRTRLSAN